MKFTLLFYTDGWESGPTVELSHIPAPGSIVWTGGRRRDEGDSMYYVDNVMYPERGMDREDTVYLYVRPYMGYTRYAPMTEADRIVERLTAVGEELARVGRSSMPCLRTAGRFVKRPPHCGTALRHWAGNIPGASKGCCVSESRHFSRPMPWRTGSNCISKSWTTSYLPSSR